VPIVGHSPGLALVPSGYQAFRVGDRCVLVFEPVEFGQQGNEFSRLNRRRGSPKKLFD
jgi:hypothetical protein